jgi:hypothetical protein
MLGMDTGTVCGVYMVREGGCDECNQGNLERQCGGKGKDQGLGVREQGTEIKE